MSQHVPEWVKSTVFYQIFPDRFAKSSTLNKPENLESWESSPTYHGFKGGDLLGIIEKLDYLVDLGVNGIYLNPIFSSTANHRYHTHDYFQVDPILGGNKAFRQFLKECHLRGIRVILDGVFNHASRSFFQFAHTLENKNKSLYRDWFLFNEKWLTSGRPLDPYGVSAAKATILTSLRRQSDIEQFGYRGWWGMPALPKLNTFNHEVQNFIFDVAQYWLNEGIDGWRLDVPEEIDAPGFWTTFREKVRSVNPEAYIVGEIWTEAPNWLQGDRFDALMNYVLAKSIMSFFFSDSLSYKTLANNNLRDIKPIAAEEFAGKIQHLLHVYSWETNQVQFNMLTSHDTPRLSNIAKFSIANIRLAVAFLLSMPGAPCIYYGDEIGLQGEHDPDCRRAFPWDKNLWNHDLHQFYKQWIHLRRQNPVLTHGDLDIVKAETDLIVIARSLPSETWLIAFNRSQSQRSITVSFKGVNYKLVVDAKNYHIEKVYQN